MTTLKLELELPDRLARDAKSAGLLSSKSLSAMLKAEMRRRAAQRLIAGAKRAGASGLPPLAEEEIMSEVKAVRRKRKQT
jgi:post-segregation antitoxin (ccd killing protein)